MGYGRGRHPLLSSFRPVGAALGYPGAALGYPGLGLPSSRGCPWIPKLGAALGSPGLGLPSRRAALQYPGLDTPATGCGKRLSAIRQAAAAQQDPIRPTSPFLAHLAPFSHASRTHDHFARTVPPPQPTAPHGSIDSRTASTTCQRRFDADTRALRSIERLTRPNPRALTAAQKPSIRQQPKRTFLRETRKR